MNPMMAMQARQAQAPVFSPRLQHAVRLLQLSSQDYAQALRDAAELNPFLEVDEPSAGSEVNAQFEAAAAFERITASPPAGTRHLSHDESFDVMQRVALPPSLAAHLHAQVGVLRLSPRERAFAHAVVESLDDDGYLRISLDDIAHALGENPAAGACELRTALCRVQALDPAGVGARDVSECLCLQLDAIGSFEVRALARRMLQGHIGLLAAQDWRGLAKALGATPAELQCAAAGIRRLNPRPGWSQGETGSRIVIADVTVKKVRGTWRTSLNAHAMPRVRLNADCARLLDIRRGAGTAALKAYLEQARWMVGTVAQRTSTILDVASAIVARQQMFLEHGPLAMKPLGLKEIADEVGVHASTVSRTVHNKYIATPAGVFELQHFFSRGLQHTAGGASAPVAVQQLIRELIAIEAPTAPLSDAALARQLAQQGFHIARRTITKYRQTLAIDPVERRRARGERLAAAS
ncbi:RNA polymerase factor sigma-54 [Variovorax sp. J22G73]|uniref:RNA polymerase factor sigma-54 n=1 Tax=unclassified Variovorax TaxID=663243 RepID=UPI002574B29D|nr:MULTISPECIES: RNA polymerase factor sigma-54 [unclassified Variovorax]MDM0009520.1 RNA polymerase factor sigma-54 [Variovorax sp. J22R203]MDM0102028.1 RNA polymerase factor sigma-54 [Variovorax sp. J22G73]